MTEAESTHLMVSNRRVFAGLIFLLNLAIGLYLLLLAEWES